MIMPRLPNTSAREPAWKTPSTVPIATAAGSCACKSQKLSARKNFRPWLSAELRPSDGRTLSSDLEICMPLLAPDCGENKLTNVSLIGLRVDKYIRAKTNDPSLEK
jgi:hypothetical protein